MKSLSAKEAQMNLEMLIANIVDDVEPTIVHAESGQSVVMLSLDEYNAWQETLYLLSTPANADALRSSIAEDKAGYRTENELID
ncbi:MAG: type II toxin-antitoxin system Phd/YefM family antitoxin [Candidatus Promineifilaceae bacterium]|nr:type II toxin-antitoxin system Phd/YefM family antitoxin [Anaerolineaceae bacterium]